MTGDRVAEAFNNVIIDRDNLRRELEQTRAELDRVKRGAQTLGKIIDDHCRDVLNATGLHHMVDETGDGDWGTIWETLAELRPQRDKALAEVAALRGRLAAVEALADDLVLEMTANIPILGPNRDWDPNDEFKRCAVDRRERVVRFRERVRAALATGKGKDNA